MGEESFVSYGTDADALQRRKEGYGLGTQSGASLKDRMAAFHEVENTYIAIFNILGGLGMILGSVGVGVVMARNLVERRGEFETLRVLGLSRALRATLVQRELHSMVAWGLGIGLISALIAVIPVMGGTVGLLDLGWMFGLVVVMALVVQMIGRRALAKL